MKKIIVSLCFAGAFFSNLAVAETTPPAEEFKQKLVSYVDSEIAILTQFKSCIQAAKNRPDFEACKNAKNEAQKKKMVEMKRDRLENRKKLLDLEEKRLSDTGKSEKK